MTCSIEGCEKPTRTRGMCSAHYTRFLRHGDANGGGRPRDKVRAECSVEDCTNTSTARSLCPKHYARAFPANRTKPSYDPGYQRRWHVITKYGFDALPVEERRLAGEPCDVCGKHTRIMCIDHCHTSGVVRGLLCDNCNQALGRVNDDPEILRKLALYVRRNVTEA